MKCSAELSIELISAMGTAAPDPTKTRFPGRINFRQSSEENGSSVIASNLASYSTIDQAGNMILEDEIGDIIGKALMGNGLSRSKLAEKTGLAQSQLDALIDHHLLPDKPSETSAWVSSLGIDPNRLMAFPDYPQTVKDIVTVDRIVTPFGHLGVNSWWLPSLGPGVLVDAGTDGTSIIRQLQKLDAIPGELWITHGHDDHISGTEALRKEYPSLLVRGPRGVDSDELLTPGDKIYGAEIIDLAGHWPNALGFVTDQFVAVGDAVFRGSIGKIPPTHWQAAINRIRHLVSQLPDELAILPGHGPPSTVGIEKNHNPML